MAKPDCQLRSLAQAVLTREPVVYTPLSDGTFSIGKDHEWQALFGFNEEVCEGCPGPTSVNKRKIEGIQVFPPKIIFTERAMDTCTKAATNVTVPTHK